MEESNRYDIDSALEESEVLKQKVVEGSPDYDSADRAVDQENKEKMMSELVALTDPDSANVSLEEVRSFLGEDKPEDF